MSKLSTVAVVGGVHGNEMTGIHLVNHLKQTPENGQRGSFNTELVIANTKAHQHNRRYIDQDLNRQFSQADLTNPDLTDYEHSRAKALNAQLGPKHDPRVDFVIDLHTTTANMGTTLIFNTNDPLVMGMALYVQSHMPHATLFYHPQERLEDNFLTSLGRFNGFLIEVGPVPQGLLRADVYLETQTALMHCLDYIDAFNTDSLPTLPNEAVAYQFTEKVRLPEADNGDIIGMVHPSLQDADYQAIHPGDPLFMMLDGSTKPYEGKQTVYGAFINEAAYYDAHIGLSFMEKITVSLNSDH